MKRMEKKTIELYRKKFDDIRKANAAQGIPELIEIAVGKTFERITKKNIGEMQNSAGIDIIHDLHCQYMMK